MTWGAVLALLGASLSASAALGAADVSDLALPSGQAVHLQDVVEGDDQTRFRFVAPDISRDTGFLTYADVELDFQMLCDAYALPWLSEQMISPALIVISMAEQETVFGTADPSVTQFFEAFTVQNNRCIWEQF